MASSKDHERIWLEPAGAPGWCEDNQWGDEGVEYVRATTAETQVQRLTEENEALRKGTEPELSCPHLDAFIAATNPPADVIDEIEAARNINSQLRYGLWHEKVRAEAAEARIKALEEALGPFADKPDDWTVDQVNAARLLLKEGGE